MLGDLSLEPLPLYLAFAVITFCIPIYDTKYLSKSEGARIEAANCHSPSLVSTMLSFQDDPETSVAGLGIPSSPRLTANQ